MKKEYGHTNDEIDKNKNLKKSKPSLYKITFSSVRMDEEIFKEILSHHFYFKAEEIDAFYSTLHLKHHLSLGKYTKDIAETKLIEISDSDSIKDRDLDVLMTVNSQ